MEAQNATSATEVRLVKALPPDLPGKASKLRSDLLALPASHTSHRYFVRDYALQHNSHTIPFDCTLHTKRRHYCQRCIVL